MNLKKVNKLQELTCHQETLGSRNTFKFSLNLKSQMHSHLPTTNWSPDPEGHENLVSIADPKTSPTPIRIQLASSNNRRKSKALMKELIPDRR